MSLSFTLPIPFKGTLYVSIGRNHDHLLDSILGSISYRGERFIRIACLYAIFTPHDWNADDHFGPRP
jgi:hypothetical protein